MIAIDFMCDPALCNGHQGIDSATLAVGPFADLFMSELSPSAPTEKKDFIRNIVRADLARGRCQHIRTRFPPEPNGFLHIGHAKAICLNFSIAKEFSGTCNLRLDDTNPSRENAQFAEAIIEDVRWLGFDWDGLGHASDYFQVYYLAAEKLITEGKAFVCDLGAEDVRDYRGTLTEPGRPSPWRDRTVEENLTLFRAMRAGKYADGTRTLRAKIAMDSGNINLRDPTLYRIKHVAHPRTGTDWPIYPMYDFAHALGDAIEGITHSLCTLEFEDHRPLYDWCVEQVDLLGHPELLAPLRAQGHLHTPSIPLQIEFSRLHINYTVMSKRKLAALVEDKIVAGWDDPRMYTLQGLRRRGYTPSALRLFADRVGISKQHSVIDFSILESCLREDLDHNANRRMAILRPLRLVLENIPADYEDVLSAPNHPKHPHGSSRAVPFSASLWIEQDDFALTPPKGWKRLVPGGEVRLRGVGIVCVDRVVQDSSGAVVELRGQLDLTSRPGLPGADRKVKGTIHWLSEKHAVATTFHLYDRLFSVPDPDLDDKSATYRDCLNPDSCVIVQGYVEPDAANACAEQVFQFERLGYFVADRYLHTSDRPVFNRSVGLRDTWTQQRTQK